MTVSTVTRAIRHAQHVIMEWEEAAHSLGYVQWREDQTRYAIIDPILRSLGWKIEDPKQCHPEYPRTLNGGSVDYALFRDLNLDTIVVKGMPPPDIIIEAKALPVSLAAAQLEKLQRYAEGNPRMTDGLAVLTNGIIWQIYEVQPDGTLTRDPKKCVDIEQESLRRAAEGLHMVLGRV